MTTSSQTYPLWTVTVPGLPADTNVEYKYFKEGSDGVLFGVEG